MKVPTPISIPKTKSKVYGTEATGDEPKFDLMENPIPTVIKNNPKI